MPVTVDELFPCRVSVGQNPGAEFTYYVRGTASRIDAIAAVLAQSPATYDPYGTALYFYPRTGIDLDPISLEEWKAIVRYGPVSPVQLDEPGTLFSFDVTAGMQQIRTSLATVGLYKRAADPNPVPDYKRAIGVTKDGEVQGAEVPVPQTTFSETRFLPAADVTDAYVKKLDGLVGAVNGAPFHGFAAGEVRFMGASGQRRGRGDWEVIFHFHVKQNETDVHVGDIETIPQKNGWDYLWVQTREEKDAAAKRVVEVPAYAYVERVSLVHDLNDVFVTV